jgi:manganese/iron transport system substrate-binding protein
MPNLNSPNHRSTSSRLTHAASPIFPNFRSKVLRQGMTVFGMLFLASCSPQASQDEPVASTDELPQVVATYSILCDFTQQIAEETVALTCLIPPGEDPHAYQATPQDRQQLETADLVIYGGYDHEPKIIKLVNAIPETVVKVAVHEVAVPQPLMGSHTHDDHEGEDHGHDHDHDHEEEEEAKTEETAPDPHVWHDVENAIAMVKVITNQLSQLNPDQAQTYQANAQTLTTELQELDNWVQTQINTVPPTQRKLVTTHDTLSYYAQAYDLEVVGALQGVIPTEKPTAARVKMLVKAVDEAKVPTIFVEANVNDQIIKTIAREAKVEVAETKLLVDGLGQAGEDSATYLGMIQHNTCVIVEALEGKCIRKSQ